MARIVLWSSLVLIFYTYFGYHLLLKGLLLILPQNARKKVQALSETPLPTVSVIVAAYNEMRIIRNRIENLLNLDYPADRLEIMIASDGSNDETVAISRAFENRGVITLDLPRQGKALAQNDAVALATGDIIVFTDADSEFDPGFLRSAVRHFQENPKVGCVIGNLTWRKSTSATARLRSLSWNLEADLRSVESKLGLLASASGAGMAFLKSLWKPMQDSIDDPDSITPLDVIKQGFKIILAEDAVVTDVPFSKARSEFKAKVRGVSKSLVGILRRWTLIDWLSHPLITWRMLSHHFLRWFAFFFGIFALFATPPLFTYGIFYQGLLLFELTAVLLVIVGMIAERRKNSVFIASGLFSFAAINLGMAVGVFRAIFGHVRGPWETE